MYMPLVMFLTFKNTKVSSNQKLLQASSPPPDFERLCMKSPAPEVLRAKSVFQIQPPISVVKFSNSISVPHII